jgi:hypothetical protein
LAINAIGEIQTCEIYDYNRGLKKLKWFILAVWLTDGVTFAF